MSDSNPVDGMNGVEETPPPRDDAEDTASRKKPKPDGDVIADIGDEVGGPA